MAGHYPFGMLRSRMTPEALAEADRIACDSPPAFATLAPERPKMPPVKEETMTTRVAAILDSKGYEVLTMPPQATVAALRRIL